MIEDVKCEFTKSDGQRCGANKIHDSQFCFWHSNKSNPVLAGRASGKSRQFKGLDINFDEIRSASDVKNLRAKLVLLGAQGKIPSNLLNSLSYTLNGLRADLQEANISDRLDQLEQKLDANT